MKNKLFRFFIIANLFTFISCSSDDPGTIETPETLKAETNLNVSYGNDPLQVYDIYLPEGRSAESTKVLILVHGGFWIGGDKSDMSSYIPIVTENLPNYAVVNMNYTLASSSAPAFPNQILAIGKVIDQLTAKSQELQILPKFGLIGASAGAHLSMMYDYVHDSDNQVKMVCDIVGPTDFRDPFYEENYPSFDLLIPFLVDESAYPEGTNFIETLSPALQVSGSSSPTILFYGSQDTLVPVENGQFLNAELESLGIPHALTVYDGGHGNWDTESFEDLEMKLSAFVSEHLPVE